MKIKELDCSKCGKRTIWRRSSDQTDGETWFFNIALGLGSICRRFWWTCMGCGKTFEQ
jgi:DNA-directed RNA polymerase subunit RPC12/RpoP